MAKILENGLIKGASGNYSKQFVYKQRGNKTHIARMPKIKKDAVASDKQVQRRDLFASASLYAQGVMTSPDLKKVYQKKTSNGNTAFNVAFKDYLKAPRVKSIETDKYAGPPGSTITVEAKDDFRVAGVTVTIQTGAGVLVEKGEALINPINRNQWIYTTTVANAAVAGSKVSAVARDLPGNMTKMEVTV